MIENRKFAVAVVVTCVLFAACTNTPGRPMVDTRPVGDGLNFLGMAFVLAALILVFGKFVVDSKFTGYTPHVMLGLLGLLTVVVAVKAIPALLIPLSVAAVILVAVAVISIRWK